jgi:hypothetical protein
VAVAVMRVRDVRVIVRELFMPMGVRMRLARRAFVRMAVVLVVNVKVIVEDLVVRVQVAVALSQEQRDAA